MGSLSRAGGVLHIAQSALSQQVAALESELNSVLLHRTTRGVSPTEAGEQLYRHAQAVLKQVDDARAAVAACSSEPTGQVIVGVPSSLVSTLALPMFNAVRARYPGIKLLVHEELSGTILEWVKNGRLTLGIAFDEGNLEGLEVTRILEERLYLVVPPKSALARRKLVTLKEIEPLDLILPSRDHGVRDRIDRNFVQAGLPAPRVVAEMNSLAMIKLAVEANHGVTILAWPSVEAEVALNRLKVVQIARPAITRVAAMCMATSSPRTRVTECARMVAIEAIREVVLRTPWRGVRFIDPV